MFKHTILLIMAFGGGVTVGTAAAAFFSVLQVIPRLVQVTQTRNSIVLYQYMIIISFILFTFVYFFDFNLNLSKYLAIPMGLIYGIIIGLISSALAEVLNVIPVLSKKLKIKDDLKYIIITLVVGKVAGSLYYWLFTL